MKTQNRTLEQRLKFDHGLTVGMNLVRFTMDGRERIAVVRIGARGTVTYIVKPTEGDMYSSWSRVRGDKTHVGEGGVIVWAARNPEIMKMFDGEPVATVPV